jgi:quercetin dioxygenase-like cupin family protein
VAGNARRASPEQSRSKRGESREKLTQHHVERNTSCTESRQTKIQTKGLQMSITKVVSLSVCLLALTLQSKAAPNDPPKALSKAAPPEAKVEELMSKDLPDFPGKEGLMITVVYPPGSQDPIHRHNADAFVYVLEGSIVMQVKGGKEVTLTAGQTFYEGPNDIHTVGRNASQTEPAKFVVFLVKNKNAPVLIPVK